MPLSILVRQFLASHVQSRFRKRRMQLFCDKLLVNDDTRILDVGGYVKDWEVAPVSPYVCIVNLEDERSTHGKISKRYGDGRSLSYGVKEFDVVYSNSVIEHVGKWEDQVAFAETVRRVGDGYFVQTPNRRFFFEPHILTPFAHFLPKPLACFVARYLSPYGWIFRPSVPTLRSILDGIVLLDKGQMAALFPDAVIHEEKWCGFCKSLIAIRPRGGVFSRSGNSPSPGGGGSEC